MQNKIIIFGDSFADPNERHDENPNVTTWYESLGFDYEIINHALSGTGPHYSFKEYYNFISNDKKKEDYICIFLLSGEGRIDFPSMHPGEMSHVNWDFNKKESSWAESEDLKIGDKIVHQLRNKYYCKEKIYYETFKSEIDFLFLTMHDELKWFNLKNIGFLYMNSLLLNMKTIVFCTYGIKILSGMGSFLDITKLNTPNFYLHPLELGHISKKEFIDLEVGGYDYVDNRRNHLSQENHTILYENMKKFIKNDYNPIPFAKNIDYSYNFGKNRDTKTGKFIYD
tara:strand:- start:168 stop:1016 length:849 start_codon:yes stop_codon:yes gene_type:complete